MSNKIKIYPPGTQTTNHQKVDWLKKITPEAHGLAKKILVTAAKYLKGGGWFSSKEKRGKQLENRIYKLEEALRKHRFREMQMQTEGPVSVIFEYFSLVSKAYPNWQPEYKLLNSFLLNDCPKYSEHADIIKKHLN